MEYEDFSIRIEPASPQGFQVLISSPAGQGRSTFLPPFNAEHVVPMLMGLARTVPPKRIFRDLKPQFTKEQERPEAVGYKLFNALLTGKARNLFERSLGIVNGPPRRGLRIRLHLEPTWPEILPICNLPWEFLCTEDGDFLSLNQFTPLVRYLDVNRPVIPLPLSRTLHVLVVSSNVQGAGPLDLEQEKNRIRASFSDKQGVSVKVIAANREVFKRELLSQPPHIVHFMGHGEYREESGEGALLFETENGASEPFSGARLAELLQGVQSPALVVLNACNTAVLAGHGALDPFAGVATALIKSGLLAVIAMQFPISDKAAILFSGTLYERLATGDSVDAAVAEARSAVHQESRDRVEWGIPVLFLRTPTGRLFDLSIVPLEEKAEAKRFLSRLSEAELRAVLNIADPLQGMEGPKNELSPLQQVEALIDTAARRGEENWLSLLEVLLHVHSMASPFSPLDESLRGWVAQPEACWQVESGEILGLGDDPQRFLEPLNLAKCSILSWQGLRFQNGCVTGRIWAPLVPWGGAAGIILRYTRNGGLLGILSFGRGEPILGLWHVGGLRLSILGSVSLALVESGEYDLSLSLKERQATLCSGSIHLERQLDAELAPGYFGLVKFGDATVRCSRLSVAVLGSQELKRTGGSSWTKPRSLRKI